MIKGAVETRLHRNLLDCLHALCSHLALKMQLTVCSLCPGFWSVLGMMNALWVPARLQNKSRCRPWKTGKREHSLRAGKRFPNQNPSSLSLRQQFTPTAHNLALALQGTSVVEIWFSLVHLGPEVYALCFCRLGTGVVVSVFPAPSTVPGTECIRNTC